MNTSIRGIQDTGKTAVMVGMIKRALDNGNKFTNGYRPDDVHVNFFLDIKGVHIHNNAGMVEYLKRMIHEGACHKIIGITEIDRLFPARFWNNREQTENLLGLWQDVKLFNQIFWDAHIGTSVDVLLRETRQRAIIPDYHKNEDRIYYSVIDRLTMQVYKGLHFDNVSKTIFPLYDRWQVIKSDLPQKSK